MGSGATSGGIAEEQYAPDTPLDQQLVSIVQADGTIKRVSKADIAEQLNQSEKLYEDLNQTWEEKLEKTEQIHKEREAALEELGISIEKGFVGVSTPKRMPHLVNLSDDPLLAECLVYNIKPGTTAVGNVEDPGTTSEIRLNGSKIMKDHCTFENVDGLVTLVPRDGAAIMVNGLRVDKPTRLRSGSRVILGDFHIFRFNHPQEARAERKEQSLLRHSVTTSQLGSSVPRPSHSRSESRSDVESDIVGSGPEFQMPPRSGRDSDWSYARREAAGAILGADQKITHLTDDELDALFDDVQRARAVRKGRPESRLFGPEDEDSESVSSYPFREKYMSNGTLDNFSFDTALTLPSTPQQNGLDPAESDDGRLDLIRDDMRSQLEKQKEDFEEKLRLAETSSTQNVDELRAEKERMEHALEAAKEDYKRQLEQQKETFARELRQASSSPSPMPRITQDGFTELVAEEKAIVRDSLARWRRFGHVRLAEAILRHAATLKEAQIMSQVMDKNVVFQFTIVGEGQDIRSSYDLILSGIAGDEDPALEAAVKPCVAVRVIDYKNTVIHLWSLEKLDQRVQTMRQMHQYLDRPDYLQHFRLENPFIEPCLPQFSIIGEANVPLTAVFEARVQDYDIEVYSTYTLEAIGRIRLSIEPSAAQAPPKMFKFNVVMHEMVGFAEREGSQLHGQMFIPDFSEEGGATTTQMIQDFDEDPIRFESVHSMSLPRSAPPSATLRVAIYAKITPMHLDRLLSWDEIREAGEKVSTKGDAQTARLPESEYWMQEEHDVYAKIKILELSETGEYLPVEIEQHSNLDPGMYQLHQGLQRRVMINLTCSSSESLQWQEVKALHVGRLQLVDQDTTILDRRDSSRQLPLKLVKEPAIVEDANGIKEFTLTGQWDSSLHGSSLLDRPTADRHSVQMSISVDIISTRVHQPMTFTLEENLQIRPRSWLRPQSMFKQLWRTTRIILYTAGIFSVSIKPASAKRASDIWRMDSQQTYVKGEEDLTNWKPRGVGLLRDYIRSQQTRKQNAEVEATKVFLRRHRSHIPSSSTTFELTPAQKGLLEKCLCLWVSPSEKPPTLILSSGAPSSFPDPKQSQSQPRPDPPPLTATILRHPKNPVLLKSSFLLTPNPTSHAWTRHFAELRHPYLHLYNVPSGNETATINLRNARIDVDPPVQRLLNEEEGTRGGQGRKNVWAVYARGGSWLFAARSEEEKGRWVLAIDEGFIDEP